jgi:hypothetical protein
LSPREAAQIVADIEAYRDHRDQAPLSRRAIAGHAPMFEIRTGGFRSCVVVEGVALWVLHVGRKGTQRRDIETAAKRMRIVFGG